MLFWKKKEKEVKELPEDASWFQKLLHNPRGKAGVKLGLYLIFILMLIIFVNVGSNKVEEEKAVNDIENYETMQKELLDNDYEYNYEINKISEESIIFKGDKKENIITGYKETKKEIIKYKIEEGIVYNLIAEEVEVIENLYEDLNSDFLDYNKFYDIIRNKPYEMIINVEKISYVYKTFYENDLNVDVTVISDNKKINKIEIKYGEDEYNLSFYDIKE